MRKQCKLSSNILLCLTNNLNPYLAKVMGNQPIGSKGLIQEYYSHIFRTHTHTHTDTYMQYKYTHTHTCRAAPEKHYEHLGH